jgi:hypothetical protein
LNFEQNLTEVEQMVERGQRLQSTGNDGDRQEGNDLILQSQRLNRILGYKREEINEMIRQNNNV